MVALSFASQPERAVARTFGFATRDGDAVMADTQPGADGLTLLPFFNGARTPDLPGLAARYMA